MAGGGGPGVDDESVFVSVSVSVAAGAVALIVVLLLFPNEVNADIDGAGNGNNVRDVNDSSPNSSSFCLCCGWINGCIIDRDDDGGDFGGADNDGRVVGATTCACACGDCIIVALL